MFRLVFSILGGRIEKYDWAFIFSSLTLTRTSGLQTYEILTVWWYVGGTEKMVQCCDVVVKKWKAGNE